ncbi:hypothetical protein PDPUS_2_00603 [Photobacterium damselae subsp. piscicida]|uniref:Uncharacterized protein n=1 Tax=Photobacterium damsela subsp. piscicida TaxID=38294 RepID=A0AAD1FPS9_PHODP|nr:protein rep [Photobacterium damselae]MDP2513868.1 hypothetical protein [Photobacterium damselae subsp. piscicida]MDP2531640.1 hypothetical protein [Photobacterium damselae subsp. piscicida]MDP2558192.1 hypothetical protein [Photobacterium damselae subsp. piscicida]MDP2567823.1 hypothetical protein [Photobacterium damselae subsp. piscicida]BAX55189.1 hypothetical protein PDPUS_2_00603 [Photobacterium damselae subsp. piscicida]
MKNLEIGDTCPHCHCLIFMPPEIEPNCQTCGEKLFDEDDYYPDE